MGPEEATVGKTYAELCRYLSKTSGIPKFANKVHAYPAAADAWFVEGGARTLGDYTQTLSQRS